MTSITVNLGRPESLRRVLLADAAVCAATGTLLALAATPLSEFLGLPGALLFYAGLALFPSAALMAWLAVREDMSRPGAWVVILGNAGWVAGSVLVFFVFSPTGLGYAFVISQAVVVAFLAELDYYGLRRIAS